MISLLKRLLAARHRIAFHLYMGIGTAVALTMVASLVAWFSFDQVGDAQRQVNERAVPEIATAFAVAQQSSTLAAAAPRLVAAETEMAFAEVAAKVASERDDFKKQLAALTQQGAAEERFARIRARGDTLIANINAIKASVSKRFEFRDRSRGLQKNLESLQNELIGILTPAIDDQLFYAMTGYRTLGSPPAPRSQHLSEAELSLYRDLAELQEGTTTATRLLASAFNLSDARLLEPLQERFNSTVDGIERKLAALGAGPLHSTLDHQTPKVGFRIERAYLHSELAPTFDRLFDLGRGDEKIFALRTLELQVAEQQRILLDRNRNLSIELVAEVEGLVNTARGSAQEATQTSTQAIFTGRKLLLAINAVGIAGAILIAWLLVGRVLLRRLEFLSNRMRHMAEGDLETKIEMSGRDEVADMAAALEIFRHNSLEAQRLNLVEKLAADLEEKNATLEEVLEDLQLAQDQIVMREKLAALGELTAGVAHEIQNPLNFVKNFAEVSEELLEELQEVLEEEGLQINDEQRDLMNEIKGDLTDNLGRIRHHGDRANRIVRDMLQMGRGSGDARATDINALLEEHARLAFHSARATNADFQLDIKEELDEEVGELDVVPQDLARVFLNMVSNACYATNEKRNASETASDYVPTLWISTQRTPDQVEVRIRDNGNGIPPDVVDKIFNPFFTTKPTDQGTGLGLALSNDIVREHGGAIKVHSEPGEFTEMTIELPTVRPSALQSAEANPDETTPPSSV
ncbi:MAG: ATP-binding protein [Gemmatimonadota bacterium]|nr:ATP-binding protein [Gemmatimonadota bacterium]